MTCNENYMYIIFVFICNIYICKYVHSTSDNYFCPEGCLIFISYISIYLKIYMVVAL